MLLELQKILECVSESVKALGYRKFIFTRVLQQLNRIVKKTARNTINQIKHDTYTDFNEIIYQLKEEGNAIVGIEITDKSINIQDFNFTNHKKIVLLLGSERNGIENIKLIDNTIAIPMFGRNSSMNVIHSLAITLYEVTNQIAGSKI